MERAGVIAFGLYFLELILKARARFRSQSFGEIQEDGTLAYKKPASSITHLIMKAGRFTEWQIVLIIDTLAAGFGALAVLSTLLS